MKMITAQEAADKWNISLRRVQDYCKKEKAKDKDQKKKEKDSPQKKSSPKTGHVSNIYLWFLLAFISSGAIIGTTVLGRRKNAK